MESTDFSLQGFQAQAWFHLLLVEAVTSAGAGGGGAGGTGAFPFSRSCTKPRNMLELFKAPCGHPLFQDFLFKFPDKLLLAPIPIMALGS